MSTDNSERSGLIPHTVSEAAQRLGIGERAVRKRAQQGKLNGVFDGRTWTIYLEPETVPENESGTGTEPIEAQFRVTNRDIVALEHERAAAFWEPFLDREREKDARIAELEAENARLKSEMERHDLIQRIEALESQLEQPETIPEPDESLWDRIKQWISEH